MRKKNLFGISFIPLCLLFFVACGDKGEGDRVEKIVMAVAPETVEKSCSPFYSEQEILSEFMRVREEGEEWKELGLGEIAGFRYEDGYEYQLEVEKTWLANPPEDASSVTYKLVKVLSKEPWSVQLGEVKRFYISDYWVVLRGESLTETEKKEIEKKILADMPPSGWLVYKFVYTDAETPEGTVFIYSGKTKTQGTFKNTENRQVYALNVSGVTKEYRLTPMFTRTSVMQRFALVETVTGRYKADYPALEAAFAEQVIGVVR